MTCWRCIRCGLVQPDTYDADCNGCGGRVELLDRPMRHHERKEYTFTIWTDGPDSEAARAARGEGSTDAGARKRMWSGLGKVISELAPTPNPSYTPAVRRVVAWRAVSPEDPSRVRVVQWDTAWRAYRHAAEARMHLHNPSAGPGLLRFVARLKRLPDDEQQAYFDRARDRLAQRLRHRDEKAGHR